MFIYTLTDSETKKIYVGLDTGPETARKRYWSHIRESKNSQRKLHKAMRGRVELFEYNVIDRATTLTELACKEMFWIWFLDTYRNGLNATTGGELRGLDWLSLDDDQRRTLAAKASSFARKFNRKRWSNASIEERRQTCKHLHTEEVYKKKADTLKIYWDTVDEAPRQEQLRGLKRAWKEMSPEVYAKRCEANKRHAAVRAEQNSIPVKLQTPDGTIIDLPNKKAIRVQFKMDPRLVISKTLKGESHKGFKAWVKNAGVS